MDIKIALAGNPNSGKTTLFNALTGSNQFVGNWPGVTVEKKEGEFKNRKGVIIVDLPGVYSLSPYTLEEVVARNYLLNEKPDAILNIVDGTNLERNLYLTTQLIELGIPTVVAVNMMDIVNKNGDVIDLKELSSAIGCPVVDISALKGEGIFEAAEMALKAAEEKKPFKIRTFFSGIVEHALAHIEEATVHGLPQEQQRWYSIKLFERDARVHEELKLTDEQKAHIEEDIKTVESALDDDAESIITNERYNYIESVANRCCVKKNRDKATVSDKIDNILTNRILALPIFALLMFLVYYLSVSTVGAWATDWANDGLFGEGFHIAGKGEYETALEDYMDENLFDNKQLEHLLADAKRAEIVGAEVLKESFLSGNYSEFTENYATYGKNLDAHGYAVSKIVSPVLESAPSPSDYGTWVLGVPALADKLFLDSEGEPVIAPWMYSLIKDGIIAGVGAVLGFVPQMLMLFLFLSFLEACGYMSRIAFVMDRIFRKFGLSGKSFIPILVGTGCGVPGIMASRTIENESDRRMTVMTTTFIPCGAKLPIIALISGALFGGAWWVAPSAYFLGIAAIVASGVMLKKTKPFVGETTPFVMELPAYHMPTFNSLMHATWERGWSFIKKAGTIILLSTVVIWFANSVGTVDGKWLFSTDMGAISGESLVEKIGKAFAWLFAPLGFGTSTAAVATLMGLMAKEEVVAVFGILDFGGMTALAGYSFMAFNLLCAPCFAAMGAIRREMNSAKWTTFAIAYQCVFAYAVSLMIYQFGNLFLGTPNLIGLISAFLVLAFLVFMLLKKPYIKKR